MVMYPNASPNPYGEQSCGQHGVAGVAQPAPSRRAWKRRTKWSIAVAGIIVTLSFAGGAAGIVATKGTPHTSSSTPTTSAMAAMQQWWSAARDDFTDTQKAAADVQQAFAAFRPGALAAACQKVHDAAEVRLQSHLPSPNSELTAELHAAIEDYHSAAHMCLAVVAGSPVNYDGEFFSSMAQANKHMNAAHDIITKMFTSI